MRCLLRLQILGAVATFFAMVPVGRAADHFLTIGGGNSPTNNQVSLEKNVLYLRRCLTDAGLGDLPHEVLFADGNGGARDLEFYDPKFEPPKPLHLLAEAFGQENGFWTHYRAHAIPNLWGPSGRKGIGNWFDTIGTKLSENDRLIIYFTGHGGHGNGARNANMSMWNESSLSVTEFTALLDKLPPRLPVVLVMVQCFSGSFADVLYNNADPAKGLSPSNRCGFFATSADRMAAGCTPDVDEENYHDYTTYFWAALFGHTRGGEVVAAPDFDGNHKVSLAEAHAYSLVTSDTIDLSMRTSDSFLRQYSKTELPGIDSAITPNIDYSRLLEAAAPVDRAVLEGLSGRLKLDGMGRVNGARGTLRQVEGDRKSTENRRKKLEKTHDGLRQELQARLKNRWPELSNLLHPRLGEIVANEGQQIVQLVESWPKWNTFEDQDKQIETLEDQENDLERQWVKLQRFVQAADRVSLANNLPHVATQELQQRYQELLAAESGTISAVRSAEQKP